MLKATELGYGTLIMGIRDADEIIVITEEGIAERGTHAELLEKNGLYAAYYNM